MGQLSMVRGNTYISDFWGYFLKTTAKVVSIRIQCVVYLGACSSLPDPVDTMETDALLLEKQRFP